MNGKIKIQSIFNYFIKLEGIKKPQSKPFPQYKLKKDRNPQFQISFFFRTSNNLPNIPQ